MLNVYLDPCTVNCRKVLAGLDLIGIEYKYHFINYFTGEHKSESYTQINPHATVPAATDGDLTITESNAILQYASDVQKSPAYPTDLKQRAQVNRWLLWEASVWFPTNYIYLVEYVVKPLLKSEPDESVIEGEAERWNKNAAILEAQLAKTPWLAGDHATIADIAVAAPMHLHAAQRLPLDKYPNLKRWLEERVEKLPCWQKTQAAVDKALLPQKTDTAQETTNGTTNGDKHTVRGSFNYTKDVQPQLTELYFFESEKAKHIHEPGDDAHEMEVTDGWHRVRDFTPDKHGFAVCDFNAKYNDDWEHDANVRAHFYPEVVEFLRKETGASRVYVFDHTIRTERNAAKKLTEETNTSQRAPVMLVHCDYTAESAPIRVQQLLPDEAEKLLQKRVAFYNVWKPVHRVVEERPLAMCDVSTTESSDYLKLFLQYRDRTGENYVLRHSPKHHWWYFPKMTPEQAIILKTYDSIEDGRARYVAHSAFTDPESPKDAALRESVEIRTMAFFD